MNPLEERCTTLTKRFDRLESVARDTEVTRQITAIEEVAIALREKSKEANQHLMNMLDGGLCDGVQWNLLSKVQELDKRLDKVLKKLADSPERVKDGQAWAQCERLAHDLYKSLDLAMKKPWQTFINERTQNRLDLLSECRDWPKYTETIKALELKECQASARLNQLPESPEDIAFIVEIDKSMTKLMDGIEFVGEPTEMMEFFKRCMSGTGVPLSELTDERLEWLRSKDFGENLRIRR